jgi:hypothetical protein
MTTERLSGAAVDELVEAVFAADHARDVGAFMALLDADVHFRFGSAPVMIGHDAVARMVRGLFASVQGIRHRLIHRWIDGSDIAYAGEVTFTVAGGLQVALPYVNTLTVNANGLVADYRIHIDPAPLTGSPG